MKQFLIFLSLFVAAVTPRHVDASKLAPFAPMANVSVGDTLTVDVRLDSEGEAVNVVEATLVYDPSVLKLEDLSRTRSFLTLWAEPPSETLPGTIHGIGGIPNGTVSAGGTVFSAIFTVLEPQPTVIRVESSASGVYPADGSGQTTVLSAGTFDVSADVASPYTPWLQSPSHFRPYQWSQNNDFRVTWDVVPGSVISYNLSRDPLDLPDNTIESSVGTTMYPSLTDGRWYFTLRMRLPQEDWGPVARWEAWVDRTPPEPLSMVVEATTGNSAFVSFRAADRTSGMRGLTAMIERSRWWKPWSTSLETRSVDGPFALSDLPTIQRLRLVAVDQAGNVRQDVWHSPRFIDGTGLLVLMAITAALVLSSILLLLVVSTARRRGHPQPRT